MAMRFHLSVLPPCHCSNFRSQSYGASVFQTPRRTKLLYNNPAVCCCFCSVRSPSALRCEISKRDLLLVGLTSPLAMQFSCAGLRAMEDDPKMEDFVDDINAYTYSYPSEVPSRNFVFKWVESRKPESYSSAAPLSPDAHLRIVSERIDFIDNLVLSVSVCPPNSQILKSRDKSSWTATDVAESVLSYKSALRVSSTQRLSESSILDVHSGDIDGEPYWYCEYLVRKSPTKTAQESNLYRHYVSSTAERDGYLYSLSASTLSKNWEKSGAYLHKAVKSFRLLPPTNGYVAPDKDPWKFW